MGKFKDLLASVMAAHPKGKPLNAEGAEVVDPVPMAPPVGYKDQPSMFEVVRQMVRDERMKAALEAEGLESPDEADDFDVGEEYDPTSPYEYDFDHIVDAGTLDRLRTAIDARVRELRIAEIRPAPGDPPLGNHSTDGGGAAAGGGSQDPAPAAARPPVDK